MKNWLTNNLSLKLLSVFFSFALWVIVVNVDDPVTTKTFKNIPVTIKNESVLTDNGLVYQVLDGSDSVSFTVKAKRSVVESLKNEDFRAVADFAERISETSIPIKVTALRHEDDIKDINLQKYTVKIDIEQEVVKTVKVNLQMVGTTADGYTVGNVQVSPSEVTMSGPQSLIDNIESMVVILDSSNASSDISTTATGQLFDKNGEAIYDERIKCDTDKFQIDAKLLTTKSVDLDFSVEGNVKNGYRYTEVRYSPTTVQIAGEPEDLEKVSTIVIPSSELNIEGADKDITKIVNVEEYLPEGIIVVDDNEKKINVTIQIQALSELELAFPVTKIDILNTPAGLDASIEGNLSAEVVLRGMAEDLERFTVDDLQLSVDVKGLTEGTHKLQTKIVSNIDSVEVVESPIVEVTLSSSVESRSVTEIQPQETLNVEEQLNTQSDTSGITGIN